MNRIIHLGEWEKFTKYCGKVIFKFKVNESWTTDINKVTCSKCKKKYNAAANAKEDRQTVVQQR